MIYINKNIDVVDGKYQFTVDRDIKDFTLTANVIYYSLSSYSATVSCYLKTININVYSGISAYTGKVWINVSGIIKYY